MSALRGHYGIPSLLAASAIHFQFFIERLRVLIPGAERPRTIFTFSSSPVGLDLHPAQFSGDFPEDFSVYIDLNRQVVIKLIYIVEGFAVRYSVLNFVVPFSTECVA